MIINEPTLASKYAVRALADTLRMEVLRHSNKDFTYSVHCAFPNTCITDAFLEEQAKKPELTKRIEGTVGSGEDLISKFPPASKTALQIVTAVERGDFAICDSSLDSNLVWANNLGTSPRRGWGIVDTVLAVLTTLIIWPILRLYYDRMCRKDGDQLDLGKGRDEDTGKGVAHSRELDQS